MNSHASWVLAFCCAASAVASSAAELVLNNGDRLTGEITAENDQVVTLSHPVLGELKVAREDIAKLSGDVIDALAEDDEINLVTEAGLLGTGWLTNWKRRLSIGVFGSEGKTQALKVNAAFKADYEDDATRWAHETAYLHNRSDGDTSDHTFYSTLRRDWLEPGSPWFRFAGGRMDFDEFKDWDYRLSGEGGVGYEFIKREDYRLIGRAGLGASQTFGGLREEFTPEGSLAVDVNWRISQLQSLAFVNTLYPNLKESGEFRNVTALNWTYDIDPAAGLGVKIGLGNAYDSLSEGSIDKNDFTYTGALEWSL